jgi:hypothetical protein
MADVIRPVQGVGSAEGSQSVRTPLLACCRGPFYGGPVLLWCSQGHHVYAADARRDPLAAGGAR